MSTSILPEQDERQNRREAWLLGLAFVFLALTAASLTLAPAARTGDWAGLAERWRPLLVLPVWAAGVWFLRRVLRSGRRSRDPMLLPIGLLLAGWGLLVVWRLAPTFGARQTVWFLVAIACLAAVLRSPVDLRWLRRYRYLWLTAGILLAALTLIFGTNPSGGEPRLWLGCCGIYLQPSEPLRLLLVAYLASYLADRLAFGKRPPLAALLPTLAPLLVMWGISVALLAVQRDLGTGTLFLALLAVLLFLASGRWQVLLAAGGLAALGGALGYALFDVVRIRLHAWLNPWADPTGGSYQIVQGLIAIASGGVFGRGPGIGSPGFVPVAHTDFIFAAVVEEWGLLGGLAMIALIATLVSRGLRVAARNREPFAVMLAAGLSLAFGLQSILIVGGVMRLLPLTGVTLPFVSYGGSSLVTSFLGLGFLVLLSGETGRAPAFSPRMRQVEAGMLLAFAALAMTLGWWSLYRAPVLTDRTDNPRRGLAERYSPRGRILDRQGRLLADTIGEQGDYRRLYPEPAAYSPVGYDSARYAQAGVEASMDAFLRGEQGHDAVTTWWAHLLSGTPPPGLDIRLTLDLEAQAIAAQALEGRRGAVLLVDATGGDILALVSSPTFDPNRLDETWMELTSRPDSPLLNRAVQGIYQPGVALAPFVMAWAQREDLAGILDRAPDIDSLEPIDGRVLGCALAPPAGESATLGLALRSGCPAPFGDLGVLLGAQRLEDMLRSFGFDQTPSVGLAAAAASPIAVPEDPQGLRAAAIGQHGLTVSPLQMARAFAALAGGGNLPALRLVDAVGMPDGSWVPLTGSDLVGATVPSSDAESILGALRIPGSGFAGMSAQAVVGAESGFLTWFLGASTGEANPRVVVVLLEMGTPVEARTIGLTVLAAASE